MAGPWRHRASGSAASAQANANPNPYPNPNPSPNPNPNANQVLACIAPQLLRCTELPDLRRLLSVGALEIDLPAFVGALERCSVAEHDLLALRLAAPSTLSTPCGA